MRTIKGIVTIMSISLALTVSNMFFPMMTSAFVSPAFVNFGEIAVGSSTTTILSVTNTNTETIYVSFSLDGDVCGFAIDTSEISIPSGERRFLQINYAPRVEGACSATLQVETAGSEVIPVRLMGVGIAADPAPTNTIVIKDFDTGVTDKLYGGQLISQRVAYCADEARNHGKFVSCVAHVTNELKREGVITEEDKDALQSCAAQAKIP